MREQLKFKRFLKIRNFIKFPPGRKVFLPWDKKNRINHNNLLFFYNFVINYTKKILPNGEIDEASFASFIIYLTFF